MTTIIVTFQKGGSGKTILAVAPVRRGGTEELGCCHHFLLYWFMK